MFLTGAALLDVRGEACKAGDRLVVAPAQLGEIGLQGGADDGSEAGNGEQELAPAPVVRPCTGARLGHRLDAGALLANEPDGLLKAGEEDGLEGLLERGLLGGDHLDQLAAAR